MSITDIINGISIKLNEVFGDDYEIYADESIEQGLETPCFFISVLNPSQSNYINTRVQRRNPFLIQYFPKNENNNLELLGIAEQLMNNLQFITLENTDILKGSNINYEIVDGVLQFKINFNVVIRETKETIEMEEIEVNFERR